MGDRHGGPIPYPAEVLSDLPGDEMPPYGVGPGTVWHDGEWTTSRAWVARGRVDGSIQLPVAGWIEQRVACWGLRDRRSVLVPYHVRHGTILLREIGERSAETVVTLDRRYMPLMVGYTLSRAWHPQHDADPWLVCAYDRDDHLMAAILAMV